MGIRYNPFTGNFDITGGSGGSGITSVNGNTGPVVVLDATDVGADPAGTAQTLFDSLGEKYVRTTRFESIGAGTSGTVTLPENSEVVLNDFGGTTDAIITQISSGKPVFQNVVTSSGAIVATSFDASGNWILVGTPSSYPIAIIYRVRQTLEDFDSDAANIIGESTIESTNTNIQLFTSSGTWTKPAGAKLVEIYTLGAGGGGGSGRKGAAGTVRCAGGAGGPGGFVTCKFPASHLTATVAVGVGAGGAGGVGISANDTNGNSGSAGGSSSFGSYLIAPGGNGGAGGTNATGTGGASVLAVASPWNFIAAAGGTASTTGGIGVLGGSNTNIAPTGGGAGSGITSGDVGLAAGGAGGALNSAITGISLTGGSGGGSNPGDAGGNGNSFELFPGFFIGTGGGGSRSTTAGNGGNGGPGAGGGSSGAGVNSVSNTGAGGTGGNGSVMIITYF